MSAFPCTEFMSVIGGGLVVVGSYVCVSIYVKSMPDCVDTFKFIEVLHLFKWLCTRYSFSLSIGWVSCYGLICLCSHVRKDHAGKWICTRFSSSLSIDVLCNIVGSKQRFSCLCGITQKFHLGCPFFGFFYFFIFIFVLYFVFFTSYI